MARKSRIPNIKVDDQKTEQILRAMRLEIEDSPVASDLVYSALWDGNLDVPTKNAVYDKIETLGGGGGGVSDGDKGDITVSGSGTVYTIDSNAVTTSKIASAAVTTAKIADANVTLAKIAPDLDAYIIAMAAAL